MELVCGRCDRRKSNRDLGEKVCRIASVLEALASRAQVSFYRVL
jgi:hypothetical protein